MSTELLLDVLWLVPAVPAVLLLLRARSRVLESIESYRRVPSQTKLSGSQVARVLLDSAGLPHVPIEEIDGELTDHYDLRHRAVRLTSHVLHESSIAAIGIAVHEVGHAIQHHSEYWQLRLRSWVVPAAVLMPPLGLGLVIFGWLLPAHELNWAGTLLFLGAILLVAAVLPGERDASRRGLALLKSSRLAHDEDTPSLEAVLAVSTLTYLALLFAAFGQILIVGLTATGVIRRTG